MKKLKTMVTYNPELTYTLPYAAIITTIKTGAADIHSANYGLPEALFDYGEGLKDYFAVIRQDITAEALADIWYKHTAPVKIKVLSILTGCDSYKYVYYYKEYYIVKYKFDTLVSEGGFFAGSEKVEGFFKDVDATIKEIDAETPSL